MPLPLVWLADVLRGAGLAVVEIPGWRTRTAPGALPRPVGVLEHHTATPTSPARPAPTVDLCIRGRPDLDGPLCHAVIGYDGTVHLIAAGRANHAGKARASGPNPAGDGNVLYVGFEWDYQGVDQGPSPQQYTAAVRATRAVLDHLGRPATAARGHRETSVTGKIDPGHVDLDQFRRDVAASATAPAPGGLETMAFTDTFTDWAHNRQTVESWMNNVDRRIAELHAAVLGLQRSRIPGDRNTTNAANLWFDAGNWTNQALGHIVAIRAALAHQQGTDPTAVADALRPVLADVIGPVIRDAVTDALGADNDHQADAIVDRIATCLAGQGAA
ncbi:peptidoglycan recognition protein family protein [Saccharopolyspora rosea]|uniref:peptidoglycan recognition protein family protein n=1 Tax=Saccharopolyspora rosea TaxID=524884 RepID=UPI0021DB4A3E|nr:N-acetylmuramoyl-L-alanine amidase [Saccharopolyspora rosea]